MNNKLLYLLVSLLVSNATMGQIFNTSRSDVLVYSGLRTLRMATEARRTFSLTVRYKFNAAKNKYKGTGAGEAQKSRM